MKSKIDNDEGNIGIITEEREQENEKRRMNKIVDKLEQRISTLEKVIGKLQLRLGDVVTYVDKKNEEAFSKYKEEHYKKAEQQ